MMEETENRSPVIRIEGLSKWYGETEVVKNLDLEIYEGEVFGLLGPNGAGKTTTNLMLLGLTEPQEGTASICGYDCTREPIRVKQITGYLPDNVGFYQDMTGRENLRFTGRLNGVTGELLEERINDLLEKTGMTEAADQKAGTYSRGMRQRLGIADVLMKDPRVIIMDEPTLGLDPEGVRELIHLIRRLAVEEGRTILISSHQLYQIQQICDRVGIFVKGELIACGKIDELASQMKREGHYAIEVAAVPDDPEFHELLMGLSNLKDVEREGSWYVVHTQSDPGRELQRKALDKGYTLTHLRQRDGDLDEIYRLYFENSTEEAPENDRKKFRQFIHHGKPLQQP